MWGIYYVPGKLPKLSQKVLLVTWIDRNSYLPFTDKETETSDHLARMLYRPKWKPTLLVIPEHSEYRQPSIVQVERQMGKQRGS